MTDASGNGHLQTTAVAKAEPAGSLKEIGVSGLHQSYGQIREEYLPELSGPRGRKVFREMWDGDATIGAIRSAIDMRLRKVEWTVAAADDTPQAEAQREFVDGCLGDMTRTWQDTIAEIMTMLEQGWSYLETLYKIRVGPDEEDPTRRSAYTDNLYGWRKFAPRGQDTLLRWEFDPETGALLAMTQQVNGVPYTIPIEKALLFRTTSIRDNPEGRSILRNTYQPWYFQKKLQIIEGIGAERDLAGLPIAWLPPEFLADDATPEQKAVANAFKALTADVRRDSQEGILMPLQYDEGGNKLYDFTLLSTGGRRSIDLDKAIGRYRLEKAMTTLSDWLFLGHEQHGTQALAGSKINVWAAALDAWLDMTAAVMNTYAIPRLMKLNGVPREVWPELRHETSAEVDAEMLGRLIDVLAGAGAPLFEDPVDGMMLLNYILRTAGLPELSRQGQAL